MKKGIIAFCLIAYLIVGIGIFNYGSATIFTDTNNGIQTNQQSLIFVPNGNLDSNTPTGSYNFTIAEPGWYRFQVNITGDIDVDVKIYMEQKVYSYYFDKMMGAYNLIDADYYVDSDSPYDNVLWISSAGVGFIYVELDHGTSGTFSASVMTVKTISQATSLASGKNHISIQKRGAYIGNFSVEDHARLYNFTIVQYIPKLSLSTIIKRAWVQINSIDGVNASHPINITYIEDGTKEHSIGQIVENVSYTDDPLKFYFDVKYLNFTYDSSNANKVKFNTTNPDDVYLFSADIMIEDADGDVISLYDFPFLFAIISSSSDYTTSFNLYDEALSLDIGATEIQIMDPYGFYGYQPIYWQSVSVPTRYVRDWISSEYNTTPSTAMVILDAQNYSYVMQGSNVADITLDLYITEANYSILSVDSSLELNFTKDKALGLLGEWKFVLLNVTGLSADKLYQIKFTLSGENWTVTSWIIHQGNYIGDGPLISRIDRPGYSYHEDKVMKNIHFIPVTTYDASGNLLDTFILRYFLEYNKNGTYDSSSVYYNPYVTNPSRGTLMFIVSGLALNNTLVNSSETAKATINFTAVGNVEPLTLDTSNTYSINENTTGYKVLKLTTKPGYEYNITISPNTSGGCANLAMYATQYKEHYLLFGLPSITTSTGKSLSIEYVDYGVFSDTKYIVIYPTPNATAVTLSVHETQPTDFPSSNTAELTMGSETSDGHMKVLKFSISSDAVYTIKISTRPGYVGIVNVMYATSDGRFPFEYTPVYVGSLFIPGGSTEETYEYTSKTSGDAYIIIYASGSGVIYITIEKQYLVPSFLNIPGLFLAAAAPVALIIGFILAWILKRPKPTKAPTKAKKTTKKKKK